MASVFHLGFFYITSDLWVPFDSLSLLLSANDSKRSHWFVSVSLFLVPLQLREDIFCTLAIFFDLFSQSNYLLSSTLSCEGKSVCEGFCGKDASVLMSCVKSFISVLINRHLKKLLLVTGANPFQTSSSSPVISKSVITYNWAWENACLALPSQISFPLPALFNLIINNKCHIPNDVFQRREINLQSWIQILISKTSESHVTIFLIRK